VPNNHMKIDPSRTALIRQAFEAEIKRRTRELKSAVWKAIVVDDVFGLRLGHGSHIMKGGLKLNQTYAFETNPDKVKSFQGWFKEQADEGLLGIAAGTDPAKPWTSQYVESAYLKGVVSTYVEGKGDSLLKTQPHIAATKADFLQRTMAGPVATNQLELLGTRTFEQMKGMTAQISQDLSRELSTGLAHGYSAQKIARNINENIDSITRKRGMLIARTEIINAHAEGQLDSLEEQDIKNVTADVEFSSAMDERVCQECASLEGAIMTTVEARGVIPVHPGCRCSWLPVVEMVKPKKKNSKTKEAIAGSKEGSVSHKINQVVDEVPRSTKEIAELSGIKESRVKAHMKWLEERQAASEIDGKWYATKSSLKDQVPTPTAKATTPKPANLDEIKSKIQTASGAKVDKVSSNWPTERLNDVSDEIARVMNEFPQAKKYLEELPNLSFEFVDQIKNSPPEVLGGYIIGNKQSAIQVTDRLGKSTSNLKTGEWMVDRSTTGVVRHEIGHAVNDTLPLNQRMEWNAISSEFRGSSDVKRLVSQYGGQDSSELFAESFSFFTHRNYGKPNTPRLPESIENYMARVTGKAAPGQRTITPPIQVPKPQPIAPPASPPTPKPPTVPKPKPAPPNTPTPIPQSRRSLEELNNSKTTKLNIDTHAFRQTNIDQNTVAEIERVLSRFEADFPGLLNDVKVGVESLGVDVGAAYRKEFSSNSLVFSKQMMEDPKKFSKIIKQAETNRWLAGGSLEHIIEHELAHAIDLGPFASTQIVPKRFAKSYIKKNPPKRLDLSGYAMTDPEEAFAEAWARIRTTGSDKLTSWEIGFRDALIKGYTENKKEIPVWLSVPKTTPKPKPTPAPKPKPTPAPKPKPTPAPKPKPTPAPNDSWVPVETKKQFSKQYGEMLNTNTRVISNDWQMTALNDAGKDIRRVLNEHPKLANLLAKNPIDLIEYVEEIDFYVNGVKMGAHGTYNSTYNVVRIATNTQNKKYSGILRQGKWSVDEGTAAIMRHEIGHHVHYNIPVDRWDQWEGLYNSYRPEFIKNQVGKYAASNHKEFFAECFSAWTHKDYGKPGYDWLPTEVANFMRDVIGPKVPI